MFSGFRALILADDTVRGIVDNRVYPLFLPQGVNYPAISYSQASGPRDSDLCGPTGRARRRLTVNSWAKTHVQVWSLADALRRVINGYRGDMSGTFVGNVTMENEFDLYEEETKVFRVFQDYIISMHEPT